MNTISRRTFCAHASGTLFASAFLGSTFCDWPQPARRPEPDEPELPIIEFGRTGRRLPRLGIGIGPLANLDDDRKAVDILLHAFSRGIRYIDAAFSYGDGAGERRVGLALAESGIDRSEFFIATKSARILARHALLELEVSLDRLGVSYVDAWQIHSVSQDPSYIFVKGGVIEAMDDARDRGLTRWIGITSHSDPVYITQAITMYDFDLALVPVNPTSDAVIQTFLPEAQRRNVAVVAMKPFAAGRLLRTGQYTAGELLRFSLAQEGVQIVVPGLDKVQYVDEAFHALQGFVQPSGSG